jgi:hypothetical protein
VTQIKKCNFVEVKEQNGIKYGFECINAAEENKNRCKEHFRKRQQKYEKFALTCQWIITKQGSNTTINRTGLPCGKLCDKSDIYCNHHLHSYTDPNSTIRTFKVRVLPTKIQRNIFTNYFGCVRKTYNLCVAKSRRNPEEKEEEFKGKTEEEKLKNEFVAFNEKLNLNYLYKTPKLPRDFAVKEFITSKNNAYDQYLRFCSGKEYKVIKGVYYSVIKPKIKKMFNLSEDKHEKQEQVYKIDKNNIELMKSILNNKKYKIKNNIDKIILEEFENNKIKMLENIAKLKEEIKKPKLKFKQKRGQQCMALPKNTKTENDCIIVYPKILKDNKSIKIMSRQCKNKLYKKLIGKPLTHELKLIKTRNNKYYIVFPYDVIPKSKIKEKSVVSCDPGARTFMTTYNPNGEIYKFGNNETTKQEYMIRNVFRRINYLRSLRKKYKRNKEYKRVTITTGILLNLEEKIKNRVDDLHYKTINYLTKHKRIYLPIFNTQNIVKNNHLYGVIKRELLSLKHGVFKARLKYKAEIEGNKVQICSERQTSKRCGKCFIAHKTGSAEIYNCSNCNLQIDRDVNGARNILLRHIKKIF